MEIREDGAMEGFDVDLSSDDTITIIRTSGAGASDMVDMTIAQAVALIACLQKMVSEKSQ